MDNLLRRFVPRAPRYVLRPNDRHIVRFTSDQNGQNTSPEGINKTKMVNLSETGMAIVMEASAAPKVGDRLMVEFPIPDHEQIAWFARVVRVNVEEHSWWAPKVGEVDHVYVGLKFEELPDGHRKAISKALEKRFLEELRESRHRYRLYMQHMITKYAWQLVVYAFFIVVGAYTLYMLGRKTPTYDPERGTGWGERFQFFEWEKRK